MKNFITLVFFTLLTLLGSQAFAAEDSSKPEMKADKYVQVYSGPQGSVIKVLPVTIGYKKKALVEISGIQTEVDGIVILHDIIKRRSGMAYTTIIRGKNVWTLEGREGYYGRMYFSARTPERFKRFDVVYNELVSKKENPRYMIERYKGQLAQGIQTKIAKFSRKDKQAQILTSLKETLNKYQSSCGSNIDIDINWNSITDENLKGLSISSYCGAPVEAMQTLCYTNKDFKAFAAAKVKTVHCEMKERMKIRFNGNGVVSWNVNKAGANMKDFNRYFFLNLYE